MCLVFQDHQTPRFQSGQSGFQITNFEEYTKSEQSMPSFCTATYRRVNWERPAKTPLFIDVIRLPNRYLCTEVKWRLVGKKGGCNSSLHVCQTTKTIKCTALDGRDLVVMQGPTMRKSRDCTQRTTQYLQCRQTIETFEASSCNQSDCIIVQIAAQGR